MPDEPFVLSPSAPPPPTEADYDAIHAAVMQTVRGRWFLSEYARRNRHADTSLILAAIDRVETLWHERRAAPSPVERVHFDLVEMAKAIAQTRSEIAAIKPDGDAKGSLSEASEELDSIVVTTEKATSDILAAAEQVQEIAWTLREHGANPASCDALDQRATEIYSACSFQDLTGQRTRKVVDVLRFLEERIRAMIAIWGNAGPAPAESVAAPHLGRDAVAELAQPEIDRIMPAPAEPAAAATAAESHDAAPSEPHAEIRAEAPTETPAEAPAQVIPAASEAPIAEAFPAAAASPDLAAVVAEITAEPVIAATVVGATALALDPVPPAAAIEAMPEPEPTPDVAGAHEAVAAPEPQPELQAEPSPATESAAGDDRSDPAVMLKRILALIRTPNGASLELKVADPPADASGDTTGAPELVMTLAVAEAPVADDPAAMPADLAADMPALADSAFAELPVAEPPVVEAPVAAADAVPEAPTAIAEAAPFAANVPEEATGELLMPLTVDQAVSELLGTGPVHTSAAPAEADAPAASAPAEAPFALAVPEFAPAPMPPAPAALAPVALAPVAPVLPEPAPSEPVGASVEAAPAAPPPEPVHAEAAPPPDDPPVIAPAPQDAPAASIAAVAPPVVTIAAATPVREPAADADAMPVVTATFRPTSQPISPALRPLLAAIAALSDEEKLALFS